MIQFSVASKNIGDQTTEEIDPLYWDLKKIFSESEILTTKAFGSWIVQIRQRPTEENLATIAKALDGHRLFLESLTRGDYYENVPIWKAWSEMKQREFLS